MDTNTIIWIVIGIVVLVAVALIAAWGARRRRRAQLQQRFGPEYHRAVEAHGERDAEHHLSDVASRRDRLEIRQLEPTARDRYTQRWEAVQSEFVDQPGPALDKADRLITDVMRDRGYPVEDFNERADLVAADHPQVVEHYRAAHTVRNAPRGQAEAPGTEDMRQAFVHYRSLFNELVHGQLPDAKASQPDAKASQREIRNA
jgi:FtsZ-interacting cell division protein ZipA